MPAITNISTETGAFSSPPPSQNKEPDNLFTSNLCSTALSPAHLIHSPSAPAQFCNKRFPTKLEAENNTGLSDNVESRLLAIEEEAQFQAEQKRNCLPSCSLSLVVAGLALLTSAGAFTYNVMRSGSNSLTNPEATPAPGNTNLTTNLFYPDPQAMPVLAPENNLKGTRQKSRQASLKPSCYYYDPELEISVEVPCKKKKKGQGRKHRPDIDKLPTCRRKKVLNRCRRKYARIGKDIEKLVINKNGKRCVCPSLAQTGKPNSLASPGYKLPPLKRGLPNRSIEDKSPISKTNSPLPTTTAPTQVEREQLFDHDCAKERENLSLAQIFRQIGKTLSRPSTEMFKESKIVFDHLIKGIGCPSQESLAKAEKITAAIDNTFSTVMSLIPGAKMLTVAQNIVGPILELIADSLEGKDIDIAKMIGVDQQILFMMRVSIPTMNREEQAALYGKLAKEVHIPTVKTSILTKRYVFRDNQAYVNVAGKEYLLKKGRDNRPFVANNRFINFNHYINHWEFVEREQGDIFSKENLQNRDHYGISLEQLPDNAWMEFKEYGFVLIHSSDKGNMKGVFLGGKFIPADWDHAAGAFVAYTHDGNYLEQRVIVSGYNGWKFERPSVKMDNNLRVFLDNCAIGIDYYPENRIGAIDDEYGLCHSEQNSFFIKKDYQYFEVEQVAGEKDTWALTNDPFTRIKYDKGIFKLTDADNMLFGLRSERIKGALSDNDSFYLETAALDYLFDHAVTTQSIPVRAIRPGLYVDKANQPLFIVNGNKFVVNSYSDRYVNLKREQDGLEGDIAFWSDHDSWVRVRDDEALETDYQELSTCRFARAPGRGEGCLPVVIETELYTRLQKYIDKGMTSNYYPVPGSLRQLETYSTPAVFQDKNTQKYYFLHGGKYFDAKLVDTFDINNPTGFPVIKVTARGGFLKREKIVADIILEHKDERVEIKEVDTFIAEKLRVNKGIASYYNENRRYRYQPVIPAIEDLVSEVEAADEVFIDSSAPKQSVSQPRMDISKHYTQVKEQLFSQRIIKSNEHEIQFIKLDAQTDPFDNRLIQAQKFVKDNVQYLKKKIIADVKSSLNYDDDAWADAGMYLSLLLDSSDTRFLTKVASVWQEIIFNAESAIDTQEIYLVRAVNKYAKAAKNFDDNPYQTSQERYTGKVVMLTEKDDSRLFINIDKLNFLENASAKPDADLAGIIIEEIFSRAGKGPDFFTIDKANGIYPAATDIVNEMIDKIEKQSLTSTQLNSLKELSRIYLKNVPAYKSYINDLLTPQKLAYLARNDRGYRTHLVLHSTPILTSMAEDLYCQLAQAKSDSTTHHPWVTTYMNKRELNTFRKELATGAATIDITKLASLNVDDLNLGAVAGRPCIFYTEPGLDLLYKTNGNYYPVEFVGKNNRVVFIGPRDKERHVYYYDTYDGSLSALGQSASRIHQLSYNRQLDVYQSISTDTGETSVLKYDTKTARLIPTGAKKIVPLVNNVIKAEYPDFDLFYPQDANHEIFLAAHGGRQLNLRNTQVPENAKVFFYTKKWHSLQGHMDDLIDLVKGKIASTESKESLEKLETYDITLDDASQINYPMLAQESHKTLIRIRPGAEVSSKNVIEAVSKMFSDKKIDIHLYMCRGL